MKRALLFAINNYQGDGDLNGCINDQINICHKLVEENFGFYIQNFRDSEVTWRNFVDKLTDLVKSAAPGDELLVHYSGHGTQVLDKSGDESDGYDEALYLYDKPLTDDTLNEILSNLKDGVNLTIMLDSCFSGTGTRNTTKRKFKRYDVDFGNDKVLVRKKSILRSNMKWILMSGCAENQTSADAYIGGTYNGAFSYFAVKALQCGISYKEWHKRIRKNLPSGMYDQIPQLEGNSELFQRGVFGSQLKKKCWLRSLFIN